MKTALTINAIVWTLWAVLQPIVFLVWWRVGRDVDSLRKAQSELEEVVSCE